MLNIFLPTVKSRSASHDGGEICAKEYFENLDRIYAPDHLVNMDT